MRELYYSKLERGTQRRVFRIAVCTGCYAALAMLLQPEANAQLPFIDEIIKTDTVIDALSPFQGDTIQVEDGDDGPTTVQIVEGGSVAGFLATESSHIILDGGISTLPIGIKDEAKLTILSGGIDCTEAICDFTEFASLITAEEDSTIVIKGMIDAPTILLRDSSTLSVFGTNLSMGVSNGRDVIEGVLLDGSEFQASVRISGNPMGRVFLVVFCPS